MLASLRPQAITLKADAQTADALVLKGAVSDRIFLGESWDYTVAVEDSPLRLRVSTPASTIFEVDAPTYLHIPYESIVPVVETPDQ